MHALVTVDLDGLEVPGARIQPGDTARATVARDYGPYVTVDVIGFPGLTRLTVPAARIYSTPMTMNALPA